MIDSVPRPARRASTSVRSRFDPSEGAPYVRRYSRAIRGVRAPTSPPAGRPSRDQALQPDAELQEALARDARGSERAPAPLAERPAFPEAIEERRWLRTEGLHQPTRAVLQVPGATMWPGLSRRYPRWWVLSVYSSTSNERIESSS